MSVIITVDGDKRDYNYHLQSSGSTLTGITYSGIVTTAEIYSPVYSEHEAGNSYYLNSNGLIVSSDADQSTTMPVYCIGCEAGYPEDVITVLLHGYFRRLNHPWSWTTGGLVYASTASGTLSQTAPSGTGDQVQVVGLAVASDTLYFKPDFTLVQI